MKDNNNFYKNPFIFIFHLSVPALPMQPADMWPSEGFCSAEAWEAALGSQPPRANSSPTAHLPRGFLALWLPVRCPLPEQEPPGAVDCELFIFCTPVHKQQALNKWLPNKYTPNDKGVVVSTAPFGRQEKTPPPTDKDTDNKS